MLEKSMAFLSTLKENNYKEWFHENKALYDEAKAEFEVFTSEMIAEVQKIDASVGSPAPKDCIFRIFRDVRFAKDKTPYKTNFGAFVARGGSRKSEYGGYYFHLEPGNSMVAGGIWMPQPDVLKAVRNEIYNRFNDFSVIIENPDFKKYFGEFDQDSMLKTAPKDYPKDWPNIGLLKYKSYIMSKPFADTQIASAQVLKEISKVFAAMVPANNFFNEVIEDLRNP